MKATRACLAVLALLASSLACRAARELVSPQARVTIVPVTASPGPGLQAPAPTLRTCPDVTGGVLQAATSYIEGDYLEYEGGEPEITYLVTYSVLGEGLELLYTDTVGEDLLPYQQDQAGHQALWDFFSALIPAGERGVLSEFSIVTDGEGELLAAVGQSTRDPRRWVLEVDILDTADRLDLTYTFLHEAAHLLTLNPAQVMPSMAVYENPDDEAIYLGEVGACPNYFPGEGCSRPDSYINLFFERFWTGIHEEWQDVNLIEDDDAYYDALDEFYYAYEDQFLTDYSATHPAEDIAEAFTHFVLLPRPDGRTVAEEKVLFFYEFPELAELRARIVDSICRLDP